MPSVKDHKFAMMSAFSHRAVIKMVLDFSQGKLIVTEFEVQVRLNVASIVLQASAEDIGLRRQPPMLIADGGGVRWSLVLDSNTQLRAIQDVLGMDAE